MDFALIGGSGLYETGLQGASRIVSTQYGDVELDIFHVNGKEVAFLPRHGKTHSVAPHLINYRANIAALKSLGVSNILATATVGSINPRIIPGKLALPTQFLDFTSGRAATFFDEGIVKHVDVSDPYCPCLRQGLLECALKKGLNLHPNVTYVCTQGPRFETPAEIEMFRRLGGDIVGMTGVPEVVLAREAGICYATVALATNWAAGMTGKALSHAEYLELSSTQLPIVRDLFFDLIQSINDPEFASKLPECSCDQEIM